MRIAREEVFGPVLTLIPFDDEEEAITIANDTEYGLAAGVWTTNLARAHRMARTLQAGTVWVITYRARDSLIRLADEHLGRPVKEREIDHTELYVADELWFCGSAAEVTPIFSVDRHPVADGTMGPMTARLRELYLGTARGQLPDESEWPTPVYGSPASQLMAASGGAHPTCCLGGIGVV